MTRSTAHQRHYLCLLAATCYCLQAATAQNNNSPPQANNDPAVTAQNTPVQIAVLQNDFDEDGDILSVVSVTDPLHGTARVNDDGRAVTYMPDLDYVGIDSFDYTVTDWNGDFDTGTVGVGITKAAASDNNDNNNNTPPQATPDMINTPRNTPVEIMVLDNDRDLDGDAITVISVTKPLFGNAVINSGGRTITYYPERDFLGFDSFDYTISDGTGDGDVVSESSKATVTIGVYLFPVSSNDRPPIAVDDMATTVQNTAVTIGVLENDEDPGSEGGGTDSLVVTLVSDPSHGTATIASDKRSIVYTPNPGFVGQDLFDYTITSTSSADSNEDSVAIAAVMVTVLAKSDEFPSSCVPAFADCQGERATCFAKLGVWPDDATSFAGWSNQLSRQGEFVCPLKIKANAKDCSGGRTIGTIAGRSWYDETSLKVTYRFQYAITAESGLALSDIALYADLYEPVPVVVDEEQGNKGRTSKTVDPEFYSDHDEFDPLEHFASGRVRVKCPRAVESIHAIFYATVCTADYLTMGGDGTGTANKSKQNSNSQPGGDRKLSSSHQLRTSITSKNHNEKNVLVTFDA